MSGSDAASVHERDAGAAPIDALPAALRARFGIRRALGRGGAGAVFDAFDRQRQMRVALKVLQRASPQAAVLFRREFRALSHVVHPNLVGLLDLVSTGEATCFTMELVDGADFVTFARDAAASRRGAGDGPADAQAALADDPPTLVDATEIAASQGTLAEGDFREAAALDRASLAGGRGFDEERLRRALRQLCCGVAALHAGGLLHRDLKPANVLVDAAERVVVVDFGLVHGLVEGDERDHDPDHVHTRRLKIAGTPEYMAPEQALEGALTGAADWYAIGVMLYEVLAGRLPFVGTVGRILVDKQTFEPPPPSRWNAQIPPDLEALCVALLRRDPAARPVASDVLERVGGTISRTHRSDPPAAAARGDREVFGREAQTRALDEIGDRLRDGRHVLATVDGPSGAGKTALLRRFRRRIADALDAVVLHARCHERETIPFKALDGLLDAITRRLREAPEAEIARVLGRRTAALAGLFPSLDRLLLEREPGATLEHSADPATRLHPLVRRERAFAELRALLERLAHGRALVITIDDAQWGDLDSASFFVSLFDLRGGAKTSAPSHPPARFPAGTRPRGVSGRVAATLFAEPLSTARVALVLACRARDELPAPMVAGVEAGVEHASTHRVARVRLYVGPLEREAAEALARSVLDDVADAPFGAEGARIAEAIAREASNLPLLIVELAAFYRGARSRGEAVSAANVSLQEMLDARLAGLVAHARPMLERIAVAGRPIALEVAVGEHAIAQEDAQLGLRSLRAARLVRVDEGTTEGLVDTAHERIRTAIVDALDHTRVLALHAELARLLERAAAPDHPAIALHWAVAGERERASLHAELAADGAAAALALELAAHLYRMAIVWAAASRASRRADLRGRRAEVLDALGRSEEAERERAQATTGRDEADDPLDSPTDARR